MWTMAKQLVRICKVVCVLYSIMIYSDELQYYVVMYIHDCKPIIPLYGIANMCNVYTLLYVHVVSYILVTSLLLGLYMK